MVNQQLPLIRGLGLILCTTMLTSCIPWKPSQNSFQANIQLNEWHIKDTNSGEFFEIDDLCTPENAKTKDLFVLIHGIYGDNDSFEALPHFLTQHFPFSSVIAMEYWSSGLAPNFQSLSELGRGFKHHIERIWTCRKPNTIIVLGHSQGGLIAKEAVMSLRDQGDPKGILAKTKLVLIGTPNYFSQYAAYNNLLVNSLFAPVTWVSGIFTAPFGKAYVYNRQAFDMADNVSPFKPDHQPNAFYSRFMLNHIAKWGEYFPEGVHTNPKTYAIVGIKNLFDQFALNDGIVHSDTLLFAGIPADRVRFVPYRHFGDLAAVDTKHHLTFEAVQEIVEDQDDFPTPPNQGLSPFPHLSYTNVSFVMEKKFEAPPQMDPEEPLNLTITDIHIDREIPLLDKLENTLEDFEADTSIAFLKSIGGLVLLPFKTLLNLAYPVTNHAERQQREEAGDLEPNWEILRLPETVLNGDHAGVIQVSRQSSESSWFFGAAKTEKGEVKFAITDEDEHEDDIPVGCSGWYPIQWDPENNVSKPIPYKIKLFPNGVNYIKIKPDNEKIQLTSAGCK